MLLKFVANLGLKIKNTLIVCGLNLVNKITIYCDFAFKISFKKMNNRSNFGFCCAINTA